MMENTVVLVLSILPLFLLPPSLPPSETGDSELSQLLDQKAYLEELNRKLESVIMMSL